MRPLNYKKEALRSFTAALIAGVGNYFMPRDFGENATERALLHQAATSLSYLFSAVIFNSKCCERSMAPTESSPLMRRTESYFKKFNQQKYFLMGGFFMATLCGASVEAELSARLTMVPILGLAVGIVITTTIYTAANLSGRIIYGIFKEFQRNRISEKGIAMYDSGSFASARDTYQPTKSAPQKEQQYPTYPDSLSIRTEAIVDTKHLIHTGGSVEGITSPPPSPLVSPQLTFKPHPSNGEVSHKLML